MKLVSPGNNMCPSIAMWALRCCVCLLCFLCSVESLVLSSARQSGSQSFNISVATYGDGASFGGLEFLRQSLLSGLPADFGQDFTGDCEVLLSSNPHYGGLPAVPGNRSRRQRVWIIVNGEGPSSEDIAGFLNMPGMLGPNDRAVILGNWWNTSLEEYAGDQVSSLWVPFASLSFAERRHATPMDLMNRTAESGMCHHPAGKLQLVRSGAVYQNRNCAEQREVFWDTLNDVLRSDANTSGVAAGRCNGRKGLGAKVRDFACSDDRGGVGYDESVGRYKGYKFVVAMEHNVNEIGYVTEKIVNAFLAGAVPIYAGASQAASTVFKPEAFLQVHPGQDDLDVAHKVTKLLKEPKEYGDLLPGSVLSETSLVHLFSWHPAVWPSHGDALRRRILDAVRRQCKSHQ